jgi:hypothetical protein
VNGGVSPGSGGGGGTGAGHDGTGGAHEDIDAAVLPETGPPIDYGPCSLGVSVKTTSTGGEYSPRNIGAIWIADGSGRFVKTLALWADERVDSLEAWLDATMQAGEDSNTVDAVTGATLSSHKTHMVTWNCTDVHGSLVPDGSYSVEFEMTDDNSAGPRTNVSFTKGAMPATFTGDQTNFKSIQVVFTP